MSWLAEPERSPAADEEGEALPVGLVVLAAAAGAGVHIAEDELHGAARVLESGLEYDRALSLRGPGYRSSERR